LEHYSKGDKSIVKRKNIRAISLFLFAMVSLLWRPTASKSYVDTQDHKSDSGLVAMSEAGVEVQELKDGKVICRPATGDEALTLLRRDPRLELHTIALPSSEEFSPQSDGLKLTLRATPQLEQFPEAKQAFLKAASVWASILQNPISVVVDVDFGPTDFGDPFLPGILGDTNFQNIGSESLYPTVRSKLISGASSAEELALYNLLPTSSVPTDIGSAFGVFGPATLFRALGIIDPVADPDGDRPTLGPPPAIGFNSAFEYDFDQSDGIDPDKIDFTALAEHEIGHLLGFFSMVGIHEQFPDSPIGVSVWDLFRFRPGATIGGFSSTPRVLSSGGVHVFFAGHPELQLSTGRGDQTGGDHEQSHHWKANEFTGRYIGVMDPTLDFGEHGPITDNDLEALDMMGYRVLREDRTVPVIESLAAGLDGDVLTLTGTAADSDGDIAQAQVKLLNGGGLTVAQTSPFAVNLGSTPEVSFRLTVTNLSKFPTAVQALLLLTDRGGHTSHPSITSFNQSVPGGPFLNSVVHNGKKLVIKGKGLGGAIEVEINGVIVAQGANASSKKIALKGSTASLNLSSGPNRVRVRNGLLFSNIFIVEIE
jgi:hypothetical protein